MKYLAELSRYVTLQRCQRVVFSVALVLAALFYFAFLSGFSITEPFVSAEVQFADASVRGLNIVPASCPSGPHYAGQCSTTPPLVCPDGSLRPANGICPGGGSCPDGSPIPSNGICGGISQPGGEGGGSGGRGSGCPVGWMATDSGGCQFVGCPSEYFRQGQQCIKQCTPQYFCSGNDLYYKNAQCVDSFTQACAWGCTAGVCNPPPAPQGDIRVSPALVKSGDTTQVIWSTQNTSSCTVTGTNGNSWNDLSSGSQGKTSSKITEQVIFKLFCNGLQGATPSTFTDTATVNLIPFWQEE